MTFLQRMVTECLSVVIAVGLFSHAAAGDENYLPLRVGNTWRLEIPWAKDPMIFEVVEQVNGSYRVRWQNPWIKKMEFYFRPVGQKILLTALDMGEGVAPLPENTVYFDFGAAEGKSWSNSVGAYTVVSRQVKVSTPAGSFDNCIHIRLQFPDDTAFDWLFAPGVGFVQFGQEPGAYTLALFTTTDGTAKSVVPRESTRPQASPASSKNSRILAMDVSMPEDGDYAKAFSIAKSVGIQAVTLSFDWKDIEIGPKQYQDPDGNLATANAYYPVNNTKVALDIRPIHTNRLAVPADLEKTPFDDAVMIERFNSMIDYTLSKIPDLQLVALYIGSELDIYIGANETLWRQYTTFYEATRQHLKNTYPNLAVGTEATFSGLTDSTTRDPLKRLNERSDIIGVSYYHIDPKTFVVKDPKDIHSIFRTITVLYPKRPIYFHQFGYPSSPALKSSEAKQREFIEESFRAWDIYADQIRFISFAWLTDTSEKNLEYFQRYYGVTDKNFVEFLRTLGFRTYADAGADKEALKTLRAETKARGW